MSSCDCYNPNFWGLTAGIGLSNCVEEKLNDMKTVLKVILLPLLFAPIYLRTCTLVRGFGAAAILNGFILVVGLIAGEADVPCIIGMVALAALAEITRFWHKYDSPKSIRWSFVPFALSFFAYTSHWWFDTEGSLAAAVEEMRPGYDQLMVPVIENVPMLIVAIVVAIPVSILSMRLAESLLRPGK